MSATALLGLATEIGAPLVKRILAGRIGAGNAELIDRVVGAVAERAGVRPDALPTAIAEERGRVIEAVRAVEDGVAPELISLYEAETEGRIALLQAEMAASEPAWKSAWRPAMMYLLGFLWLWALVLVPIVDAIGPALAGVDLGVLFNLTLAYLALYMGGHTVKEVFAKGRAR
jgi:hypothetical protein